MASAEANTFVYDADMFERLVERTKRRAMASGKSESTAVLDQVYRESLRDVSVRSLLEAILTQKATAEQQGQFQHCVRRVRKQLKKARLDKTDRQRNKTYLNVSVTDDQDQSLPIAGDSDHSLDTCNTADSAYASQKSGKDESTAAGPDVGANGEQTSPDLVETTRPGKRRKRSEVDDDDHGSMPSKTSACQFAIARHLNTNASRHSVWPARDDTSFTEIGDEDLEAAKDAYDLTCDKFTKASNQRNNCESDSATSNTATAQASRNSSPSTGPVQARSENSGVSTAANVESQDDPEGSSGAMTVPSEPAQIDPLTPAESRHAYQIIFEAATEAINPTLSRLEEKVDTLINSQTKPQQINPLATYSDSQTASLATSSSRSFQDIPGVLQSGALDDQSPELMKLFSQLAQKSAQASIHATEAARWAGEVARDMSMIMLQMGDKNQPTGKGDTKRKKK